MKRLFIALALIAQIGCAECDDSNEIQRLREELSVLKDDAADLYETLEVVELKDDPSDMMLLENELMMNAIQQATIEIEIERITKTSYCL